MAALCLLVAIVAYFNAIHMDFIGDDIGRILTQQKVFASGFINSLESILPDRPVLTASLWLNYQLSGMQVESYKWLSLLLHACNGFLIFLLLLKLSPGLQKHWPWACLPALLFVAHPLGNQAVNSISQRGVLLSAFFSLVALLITLPHTSGEERKKGFAGPLVLTSLGVLSKTNALITPFWLLLYDRWVSRVPWKESLKKTGPVFLVLLIPVVFYVFLKVNSQSEALPWWNYLLIQARMIFLYFKLMLVPVNLKFSYLPDANPNVLVNGTWLALLGHAALIALIFFIQRRWDRVLAFTLGCMYLSFLPESSFFSIRHLAFEHRAYVPLVFFILSTGVLLGRGLQISVSKAVRNSVFILGLILVSGAAGLNLNYNSKIATYEDWVFYNIQMTPEDPTLVTFNLVEFLDRQSARGPELAEAALRLHPENQIYAIFGKLFSYQRSSPQEQRQILDLIFAQLTQPENRIERTLRLNLNAFYGRQIQAFLNGVNYWEKIDDLISAQLPIMRRGGEFYHEIFFVFQKNTARLAESYFQNPPQDVERFLRVLLELKYDFGVQSEQVERQIQNLQAQAEKNPNMQSLLKFYETQGINPLPLFKQKVD